MNLHTWYKIYALSYPEYEDLLEMEGVIWYMYLLCSVLFDVKAMQLHTSVRLLNLTSSCCRLAVYYLLRNIAGALVNHYWNEPLLRETCVFFISGRIAEGDNPKSGFSRLKIE